MAANNLVELARSGQTDSLDQAWSEALSNPGRVEQLIECIQILCDQDMATMALALATPMVDALAEKDRGEDARQLAATVVRQGAHNDKLAKRLSVLIEAQDSGKDWYPVIKELAEFSTDKATEQAIASYERYCGYTTGHVVYHRAGWGEGLIEKFYADTREVKIRFADGRTREVPIRTAIDSMAPLEPGDLRAMRMINMDELQRLAKEEPSTLIRKAAQIYRGKINSTKIKVELSPAVIPKSKWASFWKRAKAAAAHDPWLQVEGSTTRPAFVLRKKPLSLGEEARRAIYHADNLGEAISVCRDYRARSHDEEARNTVIDVGHHQVEAAISATGTAQAEDTAHVLDGILLLNEHGRQTSVSAAEELALLLVSEKDGFQPENLNRLPTRESREHAVQLLPEALGDNWADTCVLRLTEFPGSVVERVVEALQEAGKGHHMLQVWGQVAPYPRRHPMMTYLMGRLYADGVFDGNVNAPDKVTMGRVLLHLTRTLSSDRRGSQEKSRLLTRLTSLLTGSRKFLEDIIEDADREALVSFVGISERGGNDFPQEVASVILRTASRKYPDILKPEDKPFWELDRIYVTRDGLARHQEDYRTLVEDKIPANSKAIGVAASHGDISENSEWEAAMEEQRNLTTRATVIDEDLRKARLIEEQQIPDGVVAPGTRVRIVDLSDNTEQTLRLLGPWDVVEDDAMNYKAPFGQALLGKRAGDTASVETSAGSRQVRIETVEKIV
ncbi:MAG: GreA/GreB family elongation factor [Planctomycetota bacterium]